MTVKLSTTDGEAGRRGRTGGGSRPSRPRS